MVNGTIFPPVASIRTEISAHIQTMKKAPQSRHRRARLSLPLAAARRRFPAAASRGRPSTARGRGGSAGAAPPAAATWINFIKLSRNERQYMLLSTNKTGFYTKMPT